MNAALPPQDRARHEAAGHRLIASRARIRAQLAEPGPPDEALPLPLALLDGAEPAALAWRWACAQADQRLGDPVRAHPWTALGLGLGAGVLIAVAKPWRWRLPSPLLLALATQLALPWVAQRLGRDPR